eukprot:scaffold29086_cov75-Phaeocystis_antarctica.AAC.3
MSTPPLLSRHRAASGVQRGQRARTPCEAAYPQRCLQMRRGSLSRSSRSQATSARPLVHSWPPAWRSGATASQRGLSTARGASLRGSAAASGVGVRAHTRVCIRARSGWVC